MSLLRKSRWILLAFLLSLIPASSYAGVLISVGFAPPVLPVYVQPECPQPGWMWTPGYWAYGDDGYYWVPGAWVPAPYTGALWTPPYWGWSGGLYVFHPGYWGPHVGYYGGVNYGFGYMGIGFAGGVWRGGIFAYNTAVVHVGVGPGWGGNRVYVDRTVVERTTIINNNHVAYSGGPGGINHAPTAEERVAMHDQHMGATAIQQQHFAAARADRTAYAKANGGHPQNVAAARPMGYNNNRGNEGRMNNNRPQFQQQHPQPQERNNQPSRNESRPQAQPHQQPQSRPQSQPRQQSRPQKEEKEPHR